MTWQLEPTPFITLNTQTEGVSIMHGRHRLTRYFMRKIHLESVLEVTVVYALLFFFFTCNFNPTSLLCDCHS